MKRRSDLLRAIAQRIDLPEAQLTHQPILELCGKNRVWIEHHYGVTEYKKERICVKVSMGEYAIEGTNLSLCRMQRQQLLIRGKIKRVEIREKAHDLK